MIFTDLCRWGRFGLLRLNATPTFKIMLSEVHEAVEGSCSITLTTHTLSLPVVIAMVIVIVEQIRTLFEVVSLSRQDWDCFWLEDTIF